MGTGAFYYFQRSESSGRLCEYGVVPTEFERRRDAFLQHVEGDEKWEPPSGDPEFVPAEYSFNPYTPWPMLSRVAELGEVALPFFVELCDGPRALYGIHGLELLGARAGAKGVAVLERLLGVGLVGCRAAVALERVSPARFWKLKLHSNPDVVAELTKKHRREGTGAKWLKRIFALGDEKTSEAAVKAIDQLRADERGVTGELRKALASSSATVREAAASALGMTELEKRKEAFLRELSGDNAWDSEFTMSPYSPFSAIDRLAELGEEALPFFCSLSATPKSGWRDDRLYGIHGIELLGARAGPKGLAALEAALGADHAGRCAAVAIERVKPDRFWELKLYSNTNAVEDLTKKHRKEGTGPKWLARILALGDQRSSAAAVKAIDQVRLEERELVLELRKALLSPFAEVRAAASWALANAPTASPVEALIESMVTSGRVGPVEAVAWHPESIMLVEMLARQRGLAFLASLLERRRCAGLHTPVEPLRAFIEDWLRNPKREWRFEEHEVHDAACCALELGDEALLPALVEAVMPLNTGYAWNPLISALKHLGPKAREALEQRKASADPERAKIIGWMLDALNQNSLGLDWADGEFVKGSLDHSTGGAFAHYSRVLRAQASAHSAFQLAWIDRAFGASILPARLEWIRSLGCRDEALLKELATPVTPLEGLRLSWRKCEAKDAERVAAAGLPGLAFTGSRDPAHTEAAKAHVERVKAACSS